MATLTVGTGPGFDFATLAGAIAASQDGDVIAVQAGTYTNDFATITTALTIVGIGGMVNLVATVPPPNLKAILTVAAPDAGGAVTIDNVAFSGVAIPNEDGGNGAGIRYESGNLVLNNCYFHDNQDGLLADADPAGMITINRSEFAGNGNADPPGSGIEHNLYVGAIAQLTIENSLFIDPIVSHDIKSRAANTTIEHSRIVDPNGTGSYEIDLPNGGNAVIANNVIEKGAGAQNSNFIAFGEEGSLHPATSLSVTGNILINDRGSANVVLNATGVPASVTGNTGYGLSAGQLVSGPVGSPENNTLLPQAAAPALDTSPPYLPVLTFSLACFVTGTRILTASGEVAVEALRPGQQVVVVRPDADGASGRGRSLRTISWIGHRSIDFTRHADPATALPIRVRAGAFADGVPRRDLLLSPDHAICIGGRLIPVRLLRNGATILCEERLRTVRYFHVELDRHAILLAEGLAAESYLDTGNRGVFENAGVPLVLHPDFTADAADGSASDDGQARREALSCAPFAADAETVAPVWRGLAARAAALGYVVGEPVTTSDPALHLQVDGRECRPATSTGDRYVFVLPRGASGVRASLGRLVSRATAPCEVAPWVEDRRRLGVAVGRILLAGPDGDFEVAPDDPSLTDGWWAAERDGAALWRWTTGDAALALPPGITRVEIRLAGANAYLCVAPDPTRRCMLA